MRGQFLVSHEAARRDQIYVASAHPGEPQILAASADFEEATPILLLGKSGSGVKRSSLRSLVIEQTNYTLEADASFRIVVAVDPTYRYSSGGTAVTPRSLRPAWTTAAANASEAVVYYGTGWGAGFPAAIVASADGANTRYFDVSGVIPAVGGTTGIVFEGDFWVDTVGSILIYAYMDEAATVNARFSWRLDFYEYPVI